MPRLLLLAAALFAVIYLTGYGRERWRGLPKTLRRTWVRHGLLLVPLLSLLALLLSGRLPLLWAGLVALWPPLTRLLLRALSFAPLLRFLHNATGARHGAPFADDGSSRGGSGRPGSDTGDGRRAGARSHGRRDSTSMDKTRALAILGLKAGATREEILAAHRYLATKVHPDVGGSDYLTAEINRARDILLGR